MNPAFAIWLAATVIFISLSSCRQRMPIYDALYTEDEYMRGDDFKVGKGGRV